MTEAEEILVVSTKLDILIEDFQRFRREYHDIGEKVRERDIKQERKNSAIFWHTIIGAFVIVSIVSFGSYVIVRFGDLETELARLETKTWSH